MINVERLLTAYSRVVEYKASNPRKNASQIVLTPCKRVSVGDGNTVQEVALFVVCVLGALICGFIIAAL